MSEGTILRNEMAEQAILGAMLVEVNCIARVASKLPVEAFFTRNYQLLYSAILQIYDVTQQNDPVVIAEYLDKHGDLNRVGGAMFLYDLQAKIVETNSVDLHVDIVLEKHTRRQLLSTSNLIGKSAENETEPIQDILDSAQQSVFALTQHHVTKGFQPITALLHKTIEQLEKGIDNADRTAGLSTGYTKLDQLTTGLHPGELAIVAARPGMGKTSFALNIAMDIALDPDTENTSAFFSLEMPAQQIVLRVLSSLAGIPFSRLRTGNVKETEQRSLANASERLFQNGSRLNLNDDSGLTISNMRLTARKLKQENPNLALIVLDYMQLMTPERKHYSNREQEVSEISREIKSLAGELEIPIIACSQLNRQLENRPDKRPKLADIRESGAIEQDADIVAFLHRDDYYEDKGELEELEVHAELLIRKQRNGPTGTIPLWFNKEIMTFKGMGV